MNTWKNGARGSEVQKIIDQNFTDLENAIKAINTPYIKDFKAPEWNLGVISIPISKYNKPSPIVELYIKQGNDYSAVLGGYKVTNYGVELLSDINYEGRVVIR